MNFLTKIILASNIFIYKFCFAQEDLLKYELTKQKDSLMYIKVYDYLNEKSNSAIYYKEIYNDSLLKYFKVYKFKVWGFHFQTYLCIKTREEMHIIKNYKTKQILKFLEKKFEQYRLTEKQKVDCLIQVFEVLKQRNDYLLVFPDGSIKE